jgi:hypothetical protein
MPQIHTPGHMAKTWENVSFLLVPLLLPHGHQILHKIGRLSDPKLEIACKRWRMGFNSLLGASLITYHLHLCYSSSLNLICFRFMSLLFRSSFCPRPKPNFNQPVIFLWMNGPTIRLHFLPRRILFRVNTLSPHTLHIMTIAYI